MQGQQNSFASLRVGSADKSGNWPIQLTVSGLKPLQDNSRYYLMVWQNGKPVAFCGTFEVQQGRPDDRHLQRRLQDHQVDPLGRHQVGPGHEVPRPGRHDNCLTGH